MLDTNIIIRAVLQPGTLFGNIAEIVRTGPHVLSVLSYWELVVKSAKGKLGLFDAPAVWWSAVLTDLAAVELPFTSAHVAALAELPPIHRDPFDRALIAQAIAEDLTLVTADGTIAQYAGPRLRVIA